MDDYIGGIIARNYKRHIERAKALLENYETATIQVESENCN